MSPIGVCIKEKVSKANARQMLWILYLIGEIKPDGIYTMIQCKFTQSFVHGFLITQQPQNTAGVSFRISIQRAKQASVIFCMPLKHA